MKNPQNVRRERTEPDTDLTDNARTRSERDSYCWTLLSILSVFISFIRVISVPYLRYTLRYARTARRRPAMTTSAAPAIYRQMLSRKGRLRLTSDI